MFVFSNLFLSILTRHKWQYIRYKEKMTVEGRIFIILLLIQIFMLNVYFSSQILAHLNSSYVIIKLSLTIYINQVVLFYFK